MIALELIARAQDLCRVLRRPLPTELKAYASGWQRQRYDLAWCWGMVKSALKERRPLWQVEAEIHRHHARLQSEKDAKDRKAGEPLTPTPGAAQEAWWEAHSSRARVGGPAPPRVRVGGPEPQAGQPGPPGGLPLPWVSHGGYRPSRWPPPARGATANGQSATAALSEASRHQGRQGP